MNNLKTENSTNAYNEEPVFYCKHCLSLNIRHIPKVDNTEYCDNCGSTEVEQSSIEDWECRYKEKYGHSYLENF